MAFDQGSTGWPPQLAASFFSFTPDSRSKSGKGAAVPASTLYWVLARSHIHPLVPF